MQFGRSAGCKLTPTRRALLAEGLCSKPSPEALGVDAEALGVGSRAPEAQPTETEEPTRTEGVAAWSTGPPPGAPTA